MQSQTVRHRDDHHDHEDGPRPRESSRQRSLDLRERVDRGSGEQNRGARRETPSQKDDRGGVKPIEKRDHAQASARRAREIHRIHPTHRKGTPRERQGDRDPRAEERRRDRQGHFCEHDRGGHRKNHGGSQADLETQRKADGHRERRCETRQIVRQGRGGEPIAANVDPHGGGGHPEHRGADHEERQVVPADDGEQPRLDDLENKRAERKQEKSGVEFGRLHGCSSSQLALPYGSHRESTP